MSVYHLMVLPRVIQKVQNRGDYDARFKLQEVPCWPLVGSLGTYADEKVLLGKRNTYNNRSHILFQREESWTCILPEWHI